jgi:hypothetical protein
MPEIITRADALAKGLKRFFTGKPCKRGHVVERRVDTGIALSARTSAAASGAMLTSMPSLPATASTDPPTPRLPEPTPPCPRLPLRWSFAGVYFRDGGGARQARLRRSAPMSQPST